MLPDLRAKKAKAGSGPSSSTNSRSATPLPVAAPKVKVYKKDLVAPVPVATPAPVSQLRSDLEGMNLLEADGIDEEMEAALPPTPVISLEKEKILELVRQREKEEKPALSLVVVGEFTPTLL